MYCRSASLLPRGLSFDAVSPSLPGADGRIVTRPWVRLCITAQGAARFVAMGQNQRMGPMTARRLYTQLRRKGPSSVASQRATSRHRRR